MKFALNAGHGYNTPGKRCLKSLDPNETREYILNKRICDKVQDILKEYSGIEVLRIDDGSELSISARAKKANAWKADYYIAVHHNAGLYGRQGGGIEVYTYLTVDQKTSDLQKAIYNSLIAHTGLKGNRSNPLRKADLGECRETAMPAVLIENGFMDSPTDTPIILTEDYADKSAEAIAKVIVKMAGAHKKTVPPTGFVDGVSQSGVTGWAYNQKDDTPVEVHIYISKDGTDVIGIPGVMANVYREDLKNAGIGNGCHGFNYECDLYRLVGAGTFKVRAYAIGEHNPQLNGEFEVVVNEPAPQPEPESEITSEPEPIPSEPEVIEEPKTSEVIEEPDDSTSDKKVEEPTIPTESVEETESNDSLIGALVKAIYKAILKLIKLLK